MRIGCGNWFAAKSITDDNITYIPRYYGGGSGSSSNRLNPSGLSNEAVSKEDKTAVQKSAFSTLNEGDNTLTAYPNPTTDFVELSYTGEVIKSVQVYDVTGSLVSQQLNETTIDLSHLPKGMYMVKVQTATTSKTVQVAKQ
ncbi:MAG: T9SS type A sorting domain-containing protein [Aureispira sp.]